ncbi:MAG: hypothetical protein PVF82_04855 [Gammaproteobacteria bacterium]|jgi:hypothetical protein
MYYKLIQTPVMGGLYMTISPKLGRKIRWLSGARHPVPINTPIRIELNDEYGTEIADIFVDNVPLMSINMVEAMRNAGVDNMDVYEVQLVDEKRKLIFDNYVAVQIIGRIAAADMAASDAFDPANIGHSIVQFRELVLDEEKIRDALIFRLHEDPTTILIHQTVKNELEKLDLKYVSMIPPNEHAIPELKE